MNWERKPKPIVKPPSRKIPREPALEYMEKVRPHACPWRGSLSKTIPRA